MLVLQFNKLAPATQEGAFQSTDDFLCHVSTLGNIIINWLSAFLSRNCFLVSSSSQPVSATKICSALRHHPWRIITKQRYSAVLFCPTKSYFAVIYCALNANGSVLIPGFPAKPRHYSFFVLNPLLTPLLKPSKHLNK